MLIGLLEVFRINSKRTYVTLCCFAAWCTGTIDKTRNEIVNASMLLSCWLLFDSLWPPWNEAHQASLSFTISQSLLRFMSFESVMPPNHLVLCHPLLLLPSIFPSIRIFSNESALCIRWPKYWSFSFSISPSSEYSGLIPFRMDWFDLLAVQGTLKSLLQQQVWKHQFFRAQTSLWSNSHICTWLLEKSWFLIHTHLSAKWCLCFLIYCLGLS